MTSMERAIDDVEAASEEDVQFHRAIAAATHAHAPSGPSANHPAFTATSLVSGLDGASNTGVDWIA